MKFCRSLAWEHATVANTGLRLPPNSYASKSHQIHSHSTTIGVSRAISFAQHGRTKGAEKANPFILPPEPHARETRDIYVDDLEATLEAHRATNTAKIIRRVQAPTDAAVKHLILADPNDLEAHAEATEDGKPSQVVKKREVKITFIKAAPSKEEGKALNPWDYWPAGTIQHHQLSRTPLKLTKGSVQEYHARAMIPISAWRRPAKEDQHTDGFRPWLKYLNEPGGDALQRLGNEITAFEKYMTPSVNETNAAKKVTAQVKKIVNSTVSNSASQVIGSYSTGLAMPWSDIDFAISLSAIQKEAAAHHKSLTGLKFQKLYRGTLARLQQAFAEDLDFKGDSELVPARIPIVRATHRRTGLEVQVQIHTGLRQQQQYTLAYLAEYPTLRPLFFVLRSCLQLRRLNITYEGGLSSYAILMMIVNALKHASGRFDPRDVASQLLRVLNFYASSDLYHDGFSVDPPRIFRKAKMSMTTEERLSRAADPVLRGIDFMAPPDPRQPYLLCLQDPADPNNDLGSKAYAIKHIQATFGMAGRTMIGAMGAWNRRSDISSKDTATMGLLDVLVCGNYRRFNSHRDQMEEYGSPALHELGMRQINGIRSRNDSRSVKYKISAREMLEKVIEVDKRKAAEKNSQKSDEEQAES